MRDAQARTTYLKDYRVPDYLIDTTELHFELHEDHTRVRSKLVLRRHPDAPPQPAPLVLDGSELPTGLYFVRLRSGQQIVVRQVVHVQ